MVKATEDTVDEIKSKLDIVDIVEEKLRLEKRGKNYVGLCPFHQEKTPSFNVSPDKQIYKCFGCGVSGDMFSFVMQSENLSFKEALNMLAKRAGVSLPEGPKRESGLEQKKEAILQLNEQAMHFYHYILTQRPEGKKALEYLESRGINSNSIENFQLGFAPNNWDSLYKAARKKGYTNENLLQAGLISERKDGSGYFDRFRNRIIFPIFDYRQRVIGFGGRILDEESKAPKYLNSPATLLFDKRKVLYGLEKALPEIRQKKQAIVAEGYTDVILVHQEGITNVVASLGTALTPQQARTVRVQAEEVIIAYDSDAAGEAATERGLDILKESGCQVKVAGFPEGLDPDSFIRSYGKKAFINILQEAQPLVEYRLQNLQNKHDLSRPEGKMLFVKELIPVLFSISNVLERDEYLKRVAEELNFSEEALRSEMKKYQKMARKAEKNGNNLVKIEQTNNILLEKLEPAEKALLSLLFVDEGVLGRVVEDMKNNDGIFNPEVEKIIKACNDLRENGKEIKFEYLRGQLEDDSLTELLADLSFEAPWEEFTGEGVLKVVDDCMLRLKIKKLSRERERVEQKLKELEKADADEGSVRSLLVEWESLKLQEQELYRSGKKEGLVNG